MCPVAGEDQLAGFRDLERLGFVMNQNQYLIKSNKQLNKKLGHHKPRKHQPVSERLSTGAKLMSLLGIKNH